MRRFLATLGALAVGDGAVAADAVKPREDAAALVQQLASPQFPARERAAKNLLKLGAAALPSVLGAIDTTADPGLRERAEALLPRLQLLAESERLLTPKVVTLDYNGVALSVVVDDLRKKTGINLVLDGVAAPTRPITLTGGDVPAWQAVERLCAAAALREDHRLDLPTPSAADVRGYGRGLNRNMYLSGEQQPVYAPGAAPIVLVDGKAEVLPGNRATAVRVLAIPGKFEGNRVVRGSGTAVLNLDVAPLPSLNWSASPTVRVTKAEDEDGRPLFADQKADVRATGNNVNEWGQFGGRLWLGGGEAYPVLSDATPRGNNPRLTPVTLRTDDRAVRGLTRFEGVVVGEVNQPNQPVITIDGLDKLVGKAFDGPYQTKLSVTAYRTEANGTVVKVHAEMPQQWVFQQRLGGRAWNGNLADDLNIGNLHNKLKFSDAAGKGCPAPQAHSTNFSGSQWTQTYDAEFHFPKSDKVGPPTKVVLTGTRVAVVEVPFAMANVKLP